MTEQKLKELLADMTLEEKVNQMDVLEVENILMSIMKKAILIKW